MTRFSSKAVIFDMDGTIVDNMPVHIETWLIFLNEHGIKMDEKTFRENGHGNLSEIISRIFKLPVDDPKVQEIGQAKEQFYRDTYRDHIVEIPGFRNTLIGLRSEQVICGLATMGDTPNIDLVIDALGVRRYFNSIIGGHEVNKGKPDPEIFEKMLNRINREPGDCLVLEDSLSGVQAAVNAGIKVVGITTTHTSDELRDAGCIAAIADYKNIDLFQFI